MKSRLMLVLILVTNSIYAQLPYIMDMVCHNPGEALFVTSYNRPEVLKEVGTKAKVFYLFESGVLGLNWQTFDPDVLPAGTADRTWVDARAQEINQKYNAAKAAGLDVYCMSDLLIFPKKLLEKYGMTTRFRDINDTLTQRLLRVELRMMFRDFPQLDGIVVRIGETYMQDAPYHSGGINNKTSSTVIIPLMQILREEVCVKLNKKVFFRSWWSFDTDQATYNAVSNGVEPHENLIVSVKHCEGDFHRGNPFSKVLGTGRHKQIVEVECAREYEGKGAFPNYIANGVIDGFEEYKNTMPTATITGLKQLYDKSPLFSGIWTWSKGGGWDGPYINNELWNELNTWVMSKWAQNPNRSEADIFNEYATSVLGLNGTSLVHFRKLALLSAQAVIRGHRSTFADIDVWWTRDHYISAPPALPSATTAFNRVIDEKHQAVEMFRQIVSLADSINMPEPVNRDFMKVSSRYGLLLHKIYAIAFDLKVCSLNPLSSRARIDSLLIQYDSVWIDYRKLAAGNVSCATLYLDKAFRNTTTGSLGEFITAMRTSLQGLNGTYIVNLMPGISTNVISFDTAPAVGKKLYSDRTYLFTGVPEVLKNSEYILWKNDYKNYTTSPMLVFSVNTDGTLYLAYDNRLTKPAWLTNNFSNTGISYAVPDTRLTLQSKNVKKGEIITLGENHNQGNLNNSTLYMPFFVPGNVSGLNENTDNQLLVHKQGENLIIEIPEPMLNSGYRLFDVSGRLVASGRLNSLKSQFPLTEGFYVLRVNDVQNHQISKKITF